MTESLLVCSPVLLHSGQCITQSQPHNCFKQIYKFIILATSQTIYSRWQKVSHLHSGQCITQSQPYNCLLYDPACTCCFAEIAFNLQYPTLIQLSSPDLSKVLSQTTLPLLYAVIPPDVGVATRYCSCLFNSLFPPENCHPVQRGRPSAAMEPAKMRLIPW